MFQQSQLNCDKSQIIGFHKMRDNRGGNFRADSRNKNELKWYSNDGKVHAKDSWKSPTKNWT